MVTPPTDKDETEEVYFVDARYISAFATQLKSILHFCLCGRLLSSLVFLSVNPTVFTNDSFSFVF